MRGLDGPGNSVEGESGALCRELDLATDMEEGKVARNQVVLDASSNVENVDLAIEDILGLLEVVKRGARGAGLDLVEAGCEV